MRERISTAIAQITKNKTICNGLVMSLGLHHSSVKEKINQLNKNPSVQGPGYVHFFILPECACRKTVPFNDK